MNVAFRETFPLSPLTNTMWHQSFYPGIYTGASHFQPKCVGPSQRFDLLRGPDPLLMLLYRRITTKSDKVTLYLPKSVFR